MNNEETIIMQPQNTDKAQQTQNVETPKEEKKSSNGKKVAAMTGAAVFGGAAGGAGTAAAAAMYNDAQTEEQETEKQETEAKVEEEAAPAAATAKPEPKVEPKPEPVVEPTVEAKVEPEEIPVSVDGNGEPDYTGHAGADPVAQNPTSTPEPQPTGNDGGDANEVQVLGVYQSEDGMEAAVLTDGQEVAAVVDVDGDGTADVLLVDENHNQHIEEGEVYDVSSEHVQMTQYEDAYLAQQQAEAQQQEQEIIAINTDDQQDYNNDAPDLSFA